MGTMARIVSTGIALFVTFALGASPARAQLTDIKAEVRKIEKFVENVEQRKACGEGSDGFCPAKYEPHIAKIRDEINKIVNSESTPENGWIISHWGSYALDVKRLVDKLALMRAKMETPRPLADRCWRTSEAMLARLKAAADKKSIDDVVAARTQAKKDGEEVTKWINEQLTIKSNMEQWHRDVETFDPKNQYDGGWMRVARAMRQSAAEMWLVWSVAWGRADKKCTEPAKGFRHADYVKLEDQFFEGMKQQLADDLKAWKDETKGTYKYDCDSMKKLHKFWCDENDGDNDPEIQPEVKQSEAEAKTMAGEMTKKVEARLAALAPFEPRLEKLKMARQGAMGSVERLQTWIAALEVIRTEVVAARTSLQKAKDSGIARGFQHPRIQLWIEFGKKQHKRMEKLSEYTCTWADQQFCAERNVDAQGHETTCKDELYYRPDCVSVTTCRIYEFKPPGSDAKRKGLNQLNGTATRKGYKELIENHYNKALAKYKEGKLNYTVVGGIHVMKEVERLCAPDGKVVFSTDDGVKQYERCKDADGKPVEYTCAPEAE
jgi:hypothetical protein